MVDAVGVGDQGVADSGQVEQPVPGRVVPRQPGDLQRQDDPDLAEGDPSRCPVTDPEMPRSLSTTRIASRGQPS
jgi:hypothetical protein